MYALILSGRSPGGGHGNPLQYCCLEHPHGQRGLAGYSAWGPKESDTTEQLSRAQNSTNKENKNRKYQSASHTVRKYYLTKHLFQFDIFVGVYVRVCVCVCVCVVSFNGNCISYSALWSEKLTKQCCGLTIPYLQFHIPKHDPVFLSLALVHLAAEHDLQWFKGIYSLCLSYLLWIFVHLTVEWSCTFDPSGLVALNYFPKGQKILNHRDCGPV